MTAALSPHQAVAYVTELSTDVRAVVVLGPGGAHLAGEARLAPAATALVAALPARPDAAQDARDRRAAADSDAPRRELVARTPAGLVFAAVDTQHAVVAVAGPFSLAGPTALDVRAALGAMRGHTPRTDPAALPAAISSPDPALQRHIEALLTAI